MKSKNKIFSFDIETIPNLHAGRVLLGMEGEKDDDIVHSALTQYHIDNANGNSFLRQPFWSVACISYIEADCIEDRDGIWYQVSNIKSAGDVKSSEKDLILGFSNYCLKNRPRLVTFNGKIFDIPVLKYRAMYYEIQFSWFYQQTSQYDKGYADKWGDKDNFDLIDFYKPASGGLKMSELCSAFGIPAKTTTNGSQVYDMYKDGKISEIRNYCEEDALATFILFVISEYHKGLINKDGYEKSLISLFKKIDEDRILHLIDFVKLAKQSPILGKFIDIKNDSLL